MSLKSNTRATEDTDKALGWLKRTGTAGPAVLAAKTNDVDSRIEAVIATGGQTLVEVEVGKKTAQEEGPERRNETLKKRPAPSRVEKVDYLDLTIALAKNLLQATVTVSSSLDEAAKRQQVFVEGIRAVPGKAKAAAESTVDTAVKAKSTVMAAAQAAQATAEATEKTISAVPGKAKAAVDAVAATPVRIQQRADEVVSSAKATAAAVQETAAAVTSTVEALGLKARGVQKAIEKLTHGASKTPRKLERTPNEKS